MICPSWGLNTGEDLNLPEKTSTAVSRLPPSSSAYFVTQGWICMQMAALPVLYLQGPEWDFLIPVVWPLLLPSPQLCLISPFDPSLPSGVRGYLSRPVASLCLLSQTTTNLLTSYSWLMATGSVDYQWAASKWHKQRNNKESVCWKYLYRKALLYNQGQYFYFGCRYYRL